MYKIGAKCKLEEYVLRKHELECMRKFSLLTKNKLAWDKQEKIKFKPYVWRIHRDVKVSKTGIVRYIYLWGEKQKKGRREKSKNSKGRDIILRKKKISKYLVKYYSLGHSKKKIEHRELGSNRSSYVPFCLAYIIYIIM